MNVIFKNAESLLEKRLPMYLIHSPLQRILYIRLSQVMIENNDWKNEVIQETKEFFHNEEIEVYFCNDHDVFIINRTCTLKRLDQFMTNLTTKLSLAPPRGLASLFEIRFDIERIQIMCRKKIEAIAIELAKQKPFEKHAEQTNITNNDPYEHIDPQLIKSLKSRRKDRKSIEIMIVEDDPFSQKLINYAIGNKYPLTMTHDGKGALMNYIKKAPDVLFLDIGLPDIDGQLVLKKIFEIDPEAFVVMFSGKGDRENVTQAIQTGAKGFVGKPFTQEKLIQYINKSPFIIQKTSGVSL